MAQLTGVHGRIVWGYHTAATIDGYTVIKTDAVWSLTAKLAAADPYQLTRRPLEFVAGPQDAWRWPILTCTVTNGRLIATLGPAQARETGNACRSAPRP